MKIEERVQNLKENMQNDETERSFQFREKLETLFSYFFQFRKTIETRRNSDLFRTVSFFAKKTVHPSYVPFSSVQCTHVFSLCVQNMHNCTLLIVPLFYSLDCLSCSIYTLKGGNV